MRESGNIQELVKLFPDYIGFIFYDKSKRFVSEFPNVEIPSTIKKVGVFVNESIENIVKLIVKYKLDAVQLHGGESAEYCEELFRSLSVVEVNVIENNSNQNVISIPLNHRKANTDTKILITERSRSGKELKLKTISTLLNHQFEIIKAFSVDEIFDFSTTKAFGQFCNLFVFDTKGKGYGGTGKKYDWNILKNYKGETPFLLSGGIEPNDVETILSFLRKQESNQCIGVDLNSGFENAPGFKNIEKLKIFFKEVKE